MADSPIGRAMMRPSRLCTALATAGLLMLSAPALAQLYDTKDITKGDLNSQDYWWARFDNMMLDLAIKQHQPEGRIAVNLAASIRRLDDLSKRYPKHEEIKTWKKHAEEVQSRIDSNADRSKFFGPECPWEESNFAQLWVNLHWAKAAIDAKDYQTARSCMQNVMQNYEIMLKPDRM